MESNSKAKAQVKLPKQRQQGTTCPVCGQANIRMSSSSSFARHRIPNLKIDDQALCSGGGRTLPEASMLRDSITKLKKEAVVLRQILLGVRLTKAKKPGDMVGYSQETIDAKEEKFQDLATGVDRSVEIIEGHPGSDDFKD